MYVQARLVVPEPLVVCSGSTSIKIWGWEKGEQENLGREGRERKKIKNSLFYAEIVKLSIISTHLKLFWEQMGRGQENMEGYHGDVTDYMERKCSREGTQIFMKWCSGKNEKKKKKEWMDGWKW